MYKVTLKKVSGGSSWIWNIFKQLPQSWTSKVFTSRQVFDNSFNQILLREGSSERWLSVKEWEENASQTFCFTEVNNLDEGTFIGLT